MTIDDEGAHRKCHWCQKLEHQKRMLNYNDHYFCSIQCKLKQEECDDDTLYRLVRPAGNRRNRQ